MKDFIQTLEEESEKLGILPPRFFRYANSIGFVTGLYHGKGFPMEKDPDNPKGSIGAFAQMNYYRILVERLKDLLGSLESRGYVPRGAGRIYCNSRFPEKSFAVASGFGVIGKNSLVIVPRLGTYLVLGGVLFPETLELPIGLDPRIDSNSPGFATNKNGNPTPLPLGKEAFPLCGNCRACQEACPTAALEKPGIVDTSLCLQAYASHPYAVPEEIAENWGTLFYGCDACQEVCPHNRLPGSNSISLASMEQLGYLGGGIELDKVLQTPDANLRKGVFRHSVLDMGWVSPQALKRNALLALSHQDVSQTWLHPRQHLLVEYANYPDPILRSAGEYAMKKLKNKVSFH